jgi:hypothetical protein
MISRRRRSAGEIIYRLTRRANQGQNDIIAEIETPAPGNRQRVFRSMQDNRSGKFQFVEFVSLHFPQFVDGSKMD